MVYGASNYTNPFYERMKLRQVKKIEMIDAWTQTSDKGSDNESPDKKKKTLRELAGLGKPPSDKEETTPSN